MPDNERAVDERTLNEIEMSFCRGMSGDYEMGRLIASCHIYRRVLRQLFEKFKGEPLRRVSVADPVVNSELVYLKELVSMEAAK